jgi:hypothetical protein
MYAFSKLLNELPEQGDGLEGAYNTDGYNYSAWKTVSCKTWSFGSTYEI